MRNAMIEDDIGMVVAQLRADAARPFGDNNLHETALKAADALELLMRQLDGARRALKLREYQVNELRAAAAFFRGSEVRTETVNEIIAFILSQDIYSWQPRILADRIKAEFC